MDIKNRCNLNEAYETVKFISEKLQVQTVDGQLATALLEQLKDSCSNRSKADPRDRDRHVNQSSRTYIASRKRTTDLKNIYRAFRVIHLPL